MSTTKTGERYLMAAVFIAIGSLGVLAGSVVVEKFSTEKPAPVVEEVLVPLCATEDSVGPCWWDADTQGNGEGISFFVAENGDTFYLMDMPNCADAPEFDCLRGGE